MITTWITSREPESQTYSNIQMNALILHKYYHDYKYFRRARDSRARQRRAQPQRQIIQVLVLALPLVLITVLQLVLYLEGQTWNTLPLWYPLISLYTPTNFIEHLCVWEIMCVCAYVCACACMCVCVYVWHDLTRMHTRMHTPRIRAHSTRTLNVCT